MRTYVGSAIGDETNKWGVYDLATGRLRSIAKLAPASEGAGREIDTASLVPSFAITRGGSLASTQALRGWLGPLFEVRSGDGAPPRERILGTGDIALRSLHLTSGRRLSWIKDGVRRSVLLLP